jgi:hypothetical protein
VPFVLGCGLAAICADFSRYHEFHNSDTIIPVMVSLYQWEPFYWGQNRLGMLLAAAAAPFSDPLTNLMVQTFLSIFGGLVAVGLFARYLLRDSTWPVVGGAGAALYLILCPPFDRFISLNGAHPYLVSFALAISGIIIAFEGRRPIALRVALALLLTALAYWYNAGVGLLIAPLALARFIGSRWLGTGWASSAPAATTGRFWQSAAFRELVGTAALTAAGTAFGWWLMTVYATGQEKPFFVPRGEWVEGWLRLKRSVEARFPDYLRLTAWIMVTGFIWLLVPATRAAALRGALVCGIAIFWLGSQIAAAGTINWVKLNGYDVRYLYAGVMALAPAAAAMWVAPLLAWAPQRARAAAWAAAAAIPIAAVAAFGPPSADAPREALDRAVGRWTGDLLDGRCTHVVGEYWQVWPVVFHANMTLAGRDDPRVLWGITLRSEVTRSKWSQTPPEAVRLGCLLPPGRSEPPREFESFWRWAYPDTIAVERRATVIVHIPAPGGGRSASGPRR